MRKAFAGLMVAEGISVLGDTGKRVLFPRAVADAGIPMTRATTVHDGLGRAATLIGAPVTGLRDGLTTGPAGD
jgi:hypothetical protein